MERISKILSHRGVLYLRARLSEGDIIEDTLILIICVNICGGNKKKIEGNHLYNY